jgi:hypothetical protein
MLVSGSLVLLRNSTSAASPGVDIWSTCKVGHTLGRVPLSVDMLLSAVSVLVIVLQSPEIPEGLMNNPVYTCRLVNRRASHDRNRIRYYGWRTCLLS